MLHMEKFLVNDIEEVDIRGNYHVCSSRNTCHSNLIAQGFPAVVIKEMHRDHKKVDLRYKSPETCYNEGRFVYKCVFSANTLRRRIGRSVFSPQLTFWGFRL